MTSILDPIDQSQPLGSLLIEILTISGGMMPISGIREALATRKHPAANYAGGTLITQLDKLVAEGRVERITNMGSRALYQLQGSGDAVAAAADVSSRRTIRGTLEPSIIDALKQRPMTTKQLVAETGASYPAVIEACKRMAARSKIRQPEKKGGEWSVPMEQMPRAEPAPKATPKADKAKDEEIPVYKLHDIQVRTLKRLEEMLAPDIAEVLENVRQRIERIGPESPR